MLGQSEVVPYLLAAGVPARDVRGVAPGVVDASRRNHVFLAAGDGRPTYVVKQARRGGESTIAREAEVIGSLRSLAGAEDLRPFLPTVVSYDAADDILVLRTESGGRDLYQRQGRHRLSAALARLAGRALASLHRLGPDTAGPRPADVDPTWALSWHRPWLKDLTALSAAATELLTMVQQARELCATLDALRASPYTATLVHGDARWGNFIACPEAGGGRRERLVLVDWELAGAGDPCMDVGAVLGEDLIAWLDSIPVGPGADPGAVIRRARLPYARLQPVVRAFWAAYLRAAEADGAALPLDRIVRFAGVRILQSTVERVQHAAELRPRALYAMDLAASAITRPDATREDLLALPAAP